MRKTKIYAHDWFIALAIGLVLGATAVARSPWLERLELAAYDMGVAATHRLPGAAERIALIAIDDPSVEELGPWPWPRDVLADALARLARARPAAVGVLLDLSEAQVERGLPLLRDIRARLDALPVAPAARASVRRVRGLLTEAERTLDGDRALARALRGAPRVHLPMYLERGPAGAAIAPASEALAAHRLAAVAAAAAVPAPLRYLEPAPDAFVRLRPPLAAFARHAHGIGHLRWRTDPDRGLRAFHAVAEHDGAHYPSLAVLLAASSINRDLRHIELEPRSAVRVGRLAVPIDGRGLAYPGFLRPGPERSSPFPAYSFRDVRAGTVPATAFTNKVVLLGISGAHADAAYPVPGGTASGLEGAAQAVAAVLNQDFYTRPAWTGAAELALAGLVLLYLMFVLGRMSGKTAALVSLLLLLGVLGAEQFLLVGEKVWLRGVFPALLLLAGHAAIAGKRYVLGERALMAADSADSNRLLGLTFQAQGQLELALDKFRRLPVDDSVLELIYNLALDFERKRQFHKAAAAYDYILEHRAGFRDCAERGRRARQGDQQTVALGPGTLILDGAEKPTLGRYQVEKEIGRGSMGVVYLGRDPRINRRVAIKTMALSREFEASELESARARFFREAETAGRLHHPNIVTIYDVGEEHDLAYIAMEYLEGQDLARYIDPERKLPFDWILDVAIPVADALDYAHRNEVVHRDIKPTNILYHEESGGVKVTDFGIARVTDASRTRTGTVLGTPPYMSPEQISGERVDGRSDLFSFGSMLFELITGDLPFTGDSFTNLMYQIINAAAPDVRKRRRDTPPALANIVKRLLQKNPKKRFQTGEELRQDLERCRRSVVGSARA